MFAEESPRCHEGVVYNSYMAARAPLTSDSISTAKVFAVLVMDRSGSMERFRDVPLRAINGYLDKMRASQYAAALEVSIVVFDHATDTLISMRPVSQIKPLPPYKNGRGTRLYGTVADVVERLNQRILVEHSQGVNATGSVVVFTDGEDTSTPPGKHLSRMRRAVVEAGDLGAQMIAIGIGIDGLRLAEDLWFPAKFAHTVDPDGVEILKAAEDVSQVVESFSAAFTSEHLPKVDLSKVAAALLDEQNPADTNPELVPAGLSQRDPD